MKTWYNFYFYKNTGVKQALNSSLVLSIIQESTSVFQYYHPHYLAHETANRNKLIFLTNAEPCLSWCTIEIYAIK